MAKENTYVLTVLLTTRFSIASPSFVLENVKRSTTLSTATVSQLNLDVTEHHGSQQHDGSQQTVAHDHD